LKGLLILLASALLLCVAWVKRDSLGWPTEESGEKMCSEVDIDVPAPHAVFRDYGENWSRLEEYKGQVIPVNFWATWCPPCEMEMPTLIQLQEVAPPVALQSDQRVTVIPADFSNSAISTV
jgi:thiol-disulfide isomerase/thioredoxin